MVEASSVGRFEHLAHVESPRYRSVELVQEIPFENSHITIRCITPAPTLGSCHASAAHAPGRR